MFWPGHCAVSWADVFFGAFACSTPSALAACQSAFVRAACPVVAHTVTPFFLNRPCGYHLAGHCCIGGCDPTWQHAVLGPWQPPQHGPILLGSRHLVEHNAWPRMRCCGQALAQQSVLGAAGAHRPCLLSPSTLAGAASLARVCQLRILRTLRVRATLCDPRADETCVDWVMCVAAQVGARVPVRGSSCDWCAGVAGLCVL